MLEICDVAEILIIDPTESVLADPLIVALKDPVATFVTAYGPLVIPSAVPFFASITLTQNDPDAAGVANVTAPDPFA
jgi:hypothetical protein